MLDVSLTTRVHFYYGDLEITMYIKYVDAQTIFWINAIMKVTVFFGCFYLEILQDTSVNEQQFRAKWNQSSFDFL